MLKAAGIVNNGVYRNNCSMIFFNKMSFLILFISLIFIATLYSQNQPLPYKNPDLNIEERVSDLLSRMTFEEKCWQLFMIPGDLSNEYPHGIFGLQTATKGSAEGAAQQLLEYGAGGSAKSVAEKINEIQKYFMNETRLGIPIIPFDEALHGLVRDGATAFPQSIGLAATWNPELVGRVANVIAKETSSRGIRQILSPVLNIARDVRWGRTEETYGEDPFLTTQMSMAFVSEFEKQGVITTPKHFVANVGDGGRDSYPIHFNERLLREIYFPAYKACFQIAGSQSVMTSYNSLDGSACSANNWLLNTILKAEWVFDGFVISDAGAVPGTTDLHYTTRDYGESAKASIENGLDVIFQTAYSHYPLFFENAKNLVNEKAVDKAVRRVLRAKFKLGLFENPFVDPNEAAKWNGCDSHKELAKRAALQSMVLLKNNKNVLPINSEVKSIAIIGQDAAEARLGGYSGPGNDKVSILSGLYKRAGESIKVQHVNGVGREAVEFVTVPANSFSCDKGEGLVAEYFDNILCKGDPVFTRIEQNVNGHWTLFSPNPKKLSRDWYSVRWTGKLESPVSGQVNIGIKGNDGYRLWIDNKLVIDNWKKQTFRTKTVEIEFQKNKKYDLKVEFFQNVGNAHIQLVWDAGVGNNWQAQIAEAVKAAEKSDLAIVVAGIEEGEFQDRAYLNLPGHQEEMILKVAETGKPVVVVLIGGSAITMTNWLDKVDAVMQAWYPGEQGGHAVAEVLFGDYNPAGRLPFTVPIHESQLPLFYNHKPTGRGDDYINLTGEPLFPFGFGLSYTTFEYSEIAFSKNVITADEKTTVSFTVTNTGPVAGNEVAQLYIKDLYASVTRPVMELKGFQRLSLKPGESQKVEFEITPDLLEMLAKDLNQIVEPGEFIIMIGGSSKNIRLRKTMTVVAK